MRMPTSFVLIGTGMRLSERIKLPWNRIEDGSVKLWDKQAIKNKLPRSIPLSTLAREALKRRASTKGGPFHGCRKNHAQQLFAPVRKKVGIEGPGFASSTRSGSPRPPACRRRRTTSS